MKKSKSFYVEARIGLSVGVEIAAKTLAEAMEKATLMKIGDFVDILGDHNDSNFEVSGVHASVGAPEVK